MIAILEAMASVAAKDAFGVLSTIAMARGRALMSGLLDVGYEAAFIFTTAFGAGPVIKNGLTPHSLAVIVAILGTAFVTAAVSTQYGNKPHSENDRLAEIAARTAALTARIVTLEQRPPGGVSRHRCSTPPCTGPSAVASPAASSTADTAVKGSKGRLGGSCPSAKTPGSRPTNR